MDGVRMRALTGTRSESVCYNIVHPRRKPSFPLRRPQEGSTLEDLPILRDRPAYRVGTAHLGDFAPHHSPQEVTEPDFVPVLEDLQLSRLPHPDEFGFLRVLRQELIRLSLHDDTRTQSLLDGRQLPDLW